MALRLDFVVNNKATPEIQKLQRDLQKLQPKIVGAEKSFKSLDSSLARLAKQAIGAYIGFQTLSKGYDLVIRNGLEYNKNIEQQTASIKTLLASTSANVDSLGNLLTAQEKYNLAGQESVKILTELEKVNANTPQTLNETAQIYRTLLVPLRNVGATQSELITLTEKLAIASNAAGIQFQSLLAGVDGLATGTVLANSDLGRFLSSIGLTNEALKESDDVVKLLTDRLSGFKALDTITVATSNLRVEWDKLTGALTTDLFESQKDTLKELTKIFKDLAGDKETITSIRNVILDFASVTVTAINGVLQTIFTLRASYLELVDTFSSQDTSKQREDLEKTAKKIQEISDRIRTGLQPADAAFTITTKADSESTLVPDKSLLDGFRDWAKNNESFVNSLASTLASASSQIFDSIYDGITEGYKDTIRANQSSIDTLNLRATGLGAFGQQGASSVANFQAIQAQITAQETLNNQYFDLSKQAREYQEIVLRLTEGFAISSGVLAGFSGNVSGVIDALNLAIDAPQIADELTSFSKFQEEYIKGTEEIQKLYDELQRTLIDVSSAVFDNIGTFEDFYDTITNGNRFARQSQSQALNLIASYTGGDVSQGGITQFIEDIINAQRAFVSESASIASGGNAEIINSIDIFSKYGLAIDSLNDSLLGSVQIVSDLIAEQNTANETIKDYVKTLRAGLGGSDSNRREAQRTLVESIRGYQQGTLSADTLIGVSRAFDDTLTPLDDNLKQQLIANLENVTEVKTTNTLLNDILLDGETSTGLLTDVTSSLAVAEDINVETRDAIIAQSSLIEQLIGLTSGAFEGILSGLSELISFIRSILSELGRVLSVLADGIGKIVEAIKNITGGVGSVVSGITGGIGGIVSSIGSSFGFADGGYTGSGGKYQVAGFVHKGEYVMSQEQVKNNPSTVAFLEGQRKGGNSTNGQYYNGGMATTSMNTSRIEQKLDLLLNAILNLSIDNGKSLKILQEWNATAVPTQEVQ